MKYRIFAVLVLLSVLCASASAQAYSVRVAYNTNLRSSHSLQARIIDTANAGTTLSVTSNHENWLGIDWNGRQVWMADWVPMTRVNDGATTSDIDNCCFIDRQCANDQEWVAGYWAYQNNQCGAPAAPARNISTPATTAPSTQADNCCQIGWQCNSDHEWQQGYWNYQQDQCEHPGVYIDGSENFKSTMDAALDRLRERAPNWYAYTLDGLTKIREVEGRRIWVYWPGGENVWGRDVGYLQRPEIISIAAILTHEACHVHRSRSGQEPGGIVGERACTEIESQALAAIGASASQVQREINLAANVEKPECQWWNNPEHSLVPEHCFH